ncbi:hypothetical protein R6Q57_009211 [Mikania cordata]
MNHTNSYNVAGISSVNSVFISQPSSTYPDHKVVFPSASSASRNTSGSSSRSVGSVTVQPATLTKEFLENIALVIGFIKCSNALRAGDLLPLFAAVGSELEQIHPEDTKEMDITWHIANSIFRAKNFTKATGRNP